ncbi:MAG TPA: hypothetical protein VFR58_15595, partial [Flavisolibacter sp.]|nr:hypothetical protein [Flavisolibacter sp.]
MFCKTLIVLAMTMTAGGIKAQPWPRPVDWSYPYKEVSALSQELLGFDIFTASLEQHIEALTKDPQRMADTVVGRPDSIYFYYRSFSKQLDHFGMSMDSAWLVFVKWPLKVYPQQEVIDSLLTIQAVSSVTGAEKARMLQGVFTKLNKQMPARVLYSKYTRSKRKEKPAWERYNYYSLGNTQPIITIARSELDGGIT